MTNKLDKIGGNYHDGKAEDAGYMTQSGNHAAGLEANDTPASTANPTSAAPTTPAASRAAPPAAQEEWT
ncbi:hypothetical protein [Pseudoduganella plicata]|uniref:Uncharacterized protein n=1 Tax=Pseudoduganella plicata TaxID=321984 RepID=A0ABX5SGT5_9BURK|nr:hypothetical protein [Pseudoduganella plicata]QBQ38691.1 hypothetical protein E1742_22845 [Pseudoduganella plicata]